MRTPVPDHDEWYEEAHDIPRPNWTLFDDWITTEADADLFDQAWDDVATNWMHRISSALNDEYRVAESPNFLLLSPHNESECLLMLTRAERTHTRITVLLEDLCAIHFGRVSVLRFSEPDHYRRYVSFHTWQDDTAALTSGMFLPGGYPHIVCLSHGHEEFQRTLSHELAHFYTSHLPWPTWLSEGIAMSMESEGRNIHLPDRDDLARHRAYWNAESVQDFWSGASWGQANAGFSLSYGLAAEIFDALQKKHQRSPEAFRAFLREAHRRDAGAEAAKRHLGMDLGDLVEDFLGPGEWSPQPW